MSTELVKASSGQVIATGGVVVAHGLVEPKGCSRACAV